MSCKTSFLFISPGQCVVPLLSHSKFVKKTLLRETPLESKKARKKEQNYSCKTNFKLLGINFSILKFSFSVCYSTLTCQNLTLPGSPATCVCLAAGGNTSTSACPAGILLWEELMSITYDPSFSFLSCERASDGHIPENHCMGLPLINGAGSISVEYEWI